ncbi:hypothetical protein [Nocardia terpenica]|uniref:hypothetical protein n=1 Tax=Nocardia terpenica TaxID=455432 RepID=UPI0018E0B3A7|nr:hypothetical protein [Nocardia terpenica]
MKEVMVLRDERQERFTRHPFFEWMQSDTLPPEQRLRFAPMGAFFIMQFRDMNRWVLRFPEPRNEFEWVIDLGTWEDEKHSRMFLEDWGKLGLDRHLNWRAADVLWWLFLSPDQEVFRRSGMEFVSLAVADHDDALVRFGHSEAGEAAGHVFLDNTSRVAAELAEQTGMNYRYFGSYHLDLETGHVGNVEGVFENRVLDPERRAETKVVCSRMADIFERIFDAFLAYAEQYIAKGAVPTRPVLPRRATAEWNAPPLTVIPIDWRDARVQQHLEMRKARAAAHPFYTWLRAENGIRPQAKLQRFIPMWVMDIFGYRDLNRYAMPYPQPDDPPRRAINDWAARLSAHSDLFLGDWDSLGLDDLLGYSASDALRFIFLDPDMDLHREHMIEFAKIALRQDDPAVRWWMMTALESTGEEFFRQTSRLAHAVERETGRYLDYLCGRHDSPMTTTAPHRPPARLTRETERTAMDIVDTVFDSMESQLWRSLTIAQADKFGAAS